MHAGGHRGGGAHRGKHLRGGETLPQPAAALRRRLADGDHLLDVLQPGAGPRDQLVPHRQHRLTDDRRRAVVDEQIEGDRDAALGAVLDRHQCLVDQFLADRADGRRDVGKRHQHRTRIALLGGLMRVRPLRPEVRDPHRLPAPGRL